MISFNKRKLREVADFLPVITVSVVGLLLSLIAFITFRDYYINADQRQFDDDATYYSNAFKSAVDRHVTSLAAIHAFVSSSHRVNRWEFSSFARQILPQNSGFKAVLWLPHLLEGQRAGFETTLQKDGLFGLKLRDTLPNGQLVVSPKREDYLPVAFVEPFESSGDLIAVDLRSNLMYAQLFQNASRSGKQEASPPVTQALIQGVNPPIVLVAFPLMLHNNPHSRAYNHGPEGYVLGILQLQSVISASFGSRAPLQATIAYGSTNDPAILFTRKDGQQVRKAQWASNAVFSRQVPFHVAGQTFYLLLRSDGNGDLLTRVYAPLGASLLVLAFTALLAQSLASTVLRKRKVEVAVVERTSELQSLNSTLQIEIEQRRQAEASLVLARDYAETANRAKSAFLATMSHELRTPLNAIIGFSSILGEGGEAFQARSTEYIREINCSGLRLLELINDILEITQMDAEERKDGDLIPITDLVEAVKSKVAPLADGAGVKLETHLDPHLPLLCGNGRRLQRALFHLLSNAVKFAGKGCQATLSVRRYQDRLEIEVSDNGVGMDPSAHIADYFSQLDASLARKHEGVGLGLTYVRRAADQHEATVRIVSAPGQGTTVILSFPAHRIAKALEVA